MASAIASMHCQQIFGFGIEQSSNSARDNQTHDNVTHENLREYIVEDMKDIQTRIDEQKDKPASCGFLKGVCALNEQVNKAEANGAQNGRRKAASTAKDSEVLSESISF